MMQRMSCSRSMWRTGAGRKQFIVGGRHRTLRGKRMIAKEKMRRKIRPAIQRPRRLYVNVSELLGFKVRLNMTRKAIGRG
jgi:hypothetical protein